jgi:hypothetical protein
VVLDKSFNDPLKAIIGGIQSNLVNGVGWFNIKPNYFISPSQGKKRYMYVLGNFNFLEYKPTSQISLQAS